MPKKDTVLDFIRKSKLSHGNRYIYDKVKYVNSHVKVIITCKIHGDFTTLPYTHYDGVNCEKCSWDEKRSVGFIDKAKLLHKERYDYSLSIFVNNTDNVKIICKAHGIFEQSPGYHLKGGGCQKCYGESIRSNTDSFIKKSKVIHNNLYDYSKVNYIIASEVVDIICKKHGVFKQLPSIHLKGGGCSKCGYSSPFNKDSFCTELKNAIFYILYIKEENFLKIGITGRSIQKRYSTKKLIPYNYEILYSKETNCSCIWELENKLKKELKAFRYTPKLKFQGRTECYTVDILPKLKSYLK